MNRVFLLSLLCAGALLLFGCVSQSYAQSDTPSRRPVLGGYSEVSTEDSVVALAVGAALLQGEHGDTTLMLVNVEKAERQVVAGTNYKLCLRVRITDAAQEIEKVEVVQTVVNRNLQGEFTVLNWGVADCAPSTDNAPTTEE